jgi:hypothetical protein
MDLEKIIDDLVYRKKMLPLDSMSASSSIAC